MTKGCILSDSTRTKMEQVKNRPRSIVIKDYIDNNNVEVHHNEALVPEADKPQDFHSYSEVVDIGWNGMDSRYRASSEPKDYRGKNIPPITRMNQVFLDKSCNQEAASKENSDELATKEMTNKFLKCSVVSPTKSRSNSKNSSPTGMALLLRYEYILHFNCLIIRYI